MTSKLRITLAGLALLGLVAIAGAALAEPAEGSGKGLKGRVVHGKIVSIAADSIVIAPEIPPHMLERLIEEGLEPPELPERVTLSIGEASQFFLAGEEARAADFSVGDIVVIRADGRSFEEPASIVIMGDPESMRERFEERGPGLKRGHHKGDKPGNPGRGLGDRRGTRPHPVFGEVTRTDDSSITIRTEVPEFILEQMEDWGIDMPSDIPLEIEVPLAERTKYFVDSDRQDVNPFKIGDKISVLFGPMLEDDGPGEGEIAYVVSDWATTKTRMEKMKKVKDKRKEGGSGEGRGPGHGKGKGKNKNKG